MARHGHIMAAFASRRGGGIGRRNGLKILRGLFSGVGSRLHSAPSVFDLPHGPATSGWLSLKVSRDFNATSMRRNGASGDLLSPVLLALGLLALWAIHTREHHFLV